MNKMRRAMFDALAASVRGHGSAMVRRTPPHVLDSRTGEELWWYHKPIVPRQVFSWDIELAQMQREMHKKYQAVVIPNRGEVAYTLVKELRRAGIKSYVLYEKGDLNWPAAKYADAAIEISNYMDMEDVLQEINTIKSHEHGIRNIAVHPGIGFWAEDPKMAAKIQSMNIEWIGPSVGVLEAMGSKSKAKQIVTQMWQNADQATRDSWGHPFAPPIIPGYEGDNQDEQFLLHEAERIGFPVMIKAVMGGGGRGIEIIHHHQDFIPTLIKVKNLSKKLFKNDQVLIEKYLHNNGHKEAQLICDGQSVRVLGFRSCDLQYKHQKIIEESWNPSPLTSPQSYLMMQQMHRFSQALGSTLLPLGLTSAITIEFFVDHHTRQFYFGEVNPRLQIEHHVTQRVTHLSIPNLQLLISQGQKLSSILPSSNSNSNFNSGSNIGSISAPSCHGHCMEARIYAVNAETILGNGNFLPVSGTVKKLRPVTEVSRGVGRGLEGIWGVEEGTEVKGVGVDGMIGKLVMWGESREECVREFGREVEGVEVEGVQTNLGLIKTILGHERLRRGNPTTGDLPEIIKDHLLLHSNKL